LLRYRVAIDGRETSLLVKEDGNARIARRGRSRRLRLGAAQLTRLRARLRDSGIDSATGHRFSPDRRFHFVEFRLHMQVHTMYAWSEVRPFGTEDLPPTTR